MSDDSPEAQFITAAYAEKVKEAFIAFAENLSVGQAEKSCTERFLRSLALTKKARDLALAAIVEEEDLQAEAAEPRRRLPEVPAGCHRRRQYERPEPRRRGERDLAKKRRRRAALFRGL